MPRALLLENLHPLGVEFLEAAGYDVTTRNGCARRGRADRGLEGVHLLGIRSRPR